MAWIDAKLPKWARANIRKLDAQLLTALASQHVVAEPWHIMFEKRTAAQVRGLAVRSPISRLTLLAEDRRGTTVTQFYAATVDATGLEFLAGLSEVVWIAWGERPPLARLPDRLLRGKSSPATLDPLPVAQGTLLLGVIDHGCPFAHRAFRTVQGGTRVLAIWDQDRLPDFPTHSMIGQLLGSPDGFSYGRQVTRIAMNGWIAAHSANGLVDETACYRTAQYGAMDGALTHGSHTLGLLAGRFWSPSLTRRPGAPRLGFRAVADAAAVADVVFVQLPRAVLQAPSEAGVHLGILDGVRYILDCASPSVERIVVVVDYGSNLWPHDSTSFFERALDAMIRQARCAGKWLEVVFPAGNSYAAAIHGRVKPMARGQSAEISWRIPTDNEVETFAEIWLPSGAGCGIRLTPQGADELVLGAAPQVKVWPDSGRPDFVVVNQLQANGEQLVSMRTAATTLLPGTGRSASGGRWRMQFDAVSQATSAPIDIYARWDVDNIGFARRASQSRFVGATPAHLVEIDVRGTALGSAGGTEVRVVGGYVGARFENFYRRAKYSSRGPTRDGRRAPHALALTDENSALRGVLGFGTRSAGVARLYGTSVAAPQAGRELAETGKLAVHVPKPLPPDVDGGFLVYEPP